MRPDRRFGRNGWSVPFAGRKSCSIDPGDLVRENFEAYQCIGTEGAGDGDVGGVATASDEHPPDPGNVIARVEGVPLATEIRLEPAGEVHRAIGWQRTDI